MIQHLLDELYWNELPSLFEEMKRHGYKGVTARSSSYVFILLLFRIHKTRPHHLEPYLIKEKERRAFIDFKKVQEEVESDLKGVKYQLEYFSQPTQSNNLHDLFLAVPDHKVSGVE